MPIEIWIALGVLLLVILFGAFLVSVAGRMGSSGVAWMTHWVGIGHMVIGAITFFLLAGRAVWVYLM